MTCRRQPRPPAGKACPESQANIPFPALTHPCCAWATQGRGAYSPGQLSCSRSHSYSVRAQPGLGPRSTGSQPNALPPQSCYIPRPPTCCKPCNQSYRCSGCRNPNSSINPSHMQGALQFKGSFIILILLRPHQSAALEAELES